METLPALSLRFPSSSLPHPLPRLSSIAPSSLSPARPTTITLPAPLRPPVPCRASVPQSQIHVSEESPSKDSFSKAWKSLESIEVFNLEGNCVHVTDLWKDRRVLIGFTRHFGCVLCMKRANLLASRKDEIDGASTSLIIIGPGKVEQAREFAKNTKFPGEIYADPSFASYEALEFASGIGSTISLTTGLRIIAAYQEGYRQDWDLSFEEETVSRGGWQQGGVLVAGPGKDNIVYIFKDIQAGDEPDMDEVLAACRK